VTLTQTKLETPAPRRLVPRPRLLTRLSAGEPRRLTLVRAPAGWGKTTLLAEWAASELEPRPFAWLALDPGDNDPVLFWSYAIAALRGVAPGIGERPLALLRAPGVDLGREMLPLLINELARWPEPLVLAIDDYHVIHNDEIHEQMELLVEHLPPQLEVVLASRTEPPLPLARLRVRGELAEVDARALSFSDEEAEALVNELHALELDREDVTLLRERTEGWAAGLYLAVLSLGRHADRRGFVAAFAGDDRHVVDYLGAEVLAGQPEEVRSFLLRTALLDRFCAPLCEAVTGESGAAEMLERVERSNYFLVPLDNRREWYRYHHLFRDLLKLELEASEPEALPVLHRRAAAWLLEHGLVSEAIHHAVAAGDVDWASDLIARHWLEFTNAGQRPTAEGWLAALPPETVPADARLCLAAAWLAFSAGRMDEVLPWTDAAERAPLPAPIRDGTTSVAAGVATLRASYHLLVGDFGRTRRYAREAMEVEEFPAWYAVAANCLGTALYWLGDVGEAVELLRETVELGREEMPIVVMFALGHLALIAVERGDWASAAEHAGRSEAVIEACGAEEYWASSRARVARGRLLERLGELEAAEAQLERGLALARRGTGPVEVAYALLSLARVRGALGRTEDARALLAEAHRLIAACPDPGPLARELLAATEAALGASAGPGRRSLEALSEELTERELTVLRLLATDLSQREIGHELYLSLNTVKSHSRRIFHKLGVSGREEAVARGRERGLI
jgi:ATP/maltotriose-dependent transcriptional regulator MalT